MIQYSILEVVLDPFQCPVLEFLTIEDFSLLDRSICNNFRSSWLEYLSSYSRKTFLQPRVIHKEQELRWFSTRLKHYRDLEVVSENGTIPCSFYSEMHFAARKFDDGNIIRLLLSRNGAVHIDTQDPFGRTPLHIACQYGNIAAAKSLVALGANVHILNNYGFTAERSGTANGHVFALYEPEPVKKQHWKPVRKRKVAQKTLFPSVSNKLSFY